MINNKQNLHFLWCLSLIILLSGIANIALYSQDLGLVQGLSDDIPNPQAQQMSNRGQELFEQGDYEGAIHYFAEAWRLTGSASQGTYILQNLSISHNNLANQYARIQNYDIALMHSRWAIFYNMNNQTLYKNYQNIYQNSDLSWDHYLERLSNTQKLRNEGHLEEALAEYIILDKTINKIKEIKTIKLEIEYIQLLQALYTKYSKSLLAETLWNQALQIYTKYSKQDHRISIIMANLYTQKGDYVKAIDLYEIALEQYPDNQDILNGLVMAWEGVYKLNPNNSNNLLGLGRALLRVNKEQEADYYFDQAVKINPASIEQVRLISGESLYFLRKYPEALKSYEKGSLAYSRNQYTQARQYFQQSISSLPPEIQMADLYYNLALADIGDNDYAKAQADLEQATKINPNHIKAKEQLSQLQNKIEQKSSEYIQQGIKLQQQNQISQALEYYQKANAMSPRNAEILYNLGTAYQKAGNLQQSLNSYTKALELDPYNTQYQSAKLSIERAIKTGYLDNIQADSLISEAVKAQQAKDFRTAIDRYLQAIRLNPHNAQAHFNLATVYHILKQYNSAIQAYQTAYQINSLAYPEAQYYIGTLYQMQGKLPQANTAYREYLQLSPQGIYANIIKQKLMNM